MEQLKWQTSLVTVVSTVAIVVSDGLNTWGTPKSQNLESRVRSLHGHCGKYPNKKGDFQQQTVSLPEGIPILDKP